MLSKACEYGIRAVIFVAFKNFEELKPGLELIATDLNLPKPYTGKILQQLTKKKLLESKKGPGGGFFLNEKQMQARIYDIILSIDGEDTFESCFFGMDKCTDSEPCPVHDVYTKVKADLIRGLREHTIEELAYKIVKGEVFLRNLLPDSK